MEKKVILVLSEYKDSPTNTVVSWLVSMGEKVIRINEEDKLEFNNSKTNKKHSYIY